MDDLYSSHAESVWDSYRFILEGTLAAQERNVELTLRVFESGMEAMEQGVELNRDAAQELVRKMRGQREILEALSRESADVYEGSLGFLSEPHSEVSEDPADSQPE